MNINCTPTCIDTIAREKERSAKAQSGLLFFFHLAVLVLPGQMYNSEKEPGPIREAPPVPKGPICRHEEFGQSTCEKDQYSVQQLQAIEL